MRITQPLIAVRSELETKASSLTRIIEQCNDIIRSNPLMHCPSCCQVDKVKLTAIRPMPESNEDESINIECGRCSIQTKPAYWFVSDPESIIKALLWTIEKWHARALPAMEAEHD